MAKNIYDDLFDDADASFNGLYGNALKALHGLSAEEISSVTPGTTDMRTYTVLMKVVQDASAKNLAQAQLVSNIKSLGDVAVKIAKKIPQLATLFE